MQPRTAQVRRGLGRQNTMAQKQAVRLSQIDPHRLAEAVAQAIRRHFVRLGLQTATDEQEALAQRVATAVEQLAAYAVRGEAPEQPVAELLRAIALPVWGEPPTGMPPNSTGARQRKNGDDLDWTAPASHARRRGTEASRAARRSRGSS